MTFMEELYGKYRDAGEKIQKLEALIQKHQKRLKKLEEGTGWYKQILIPLAEKLSKELNMPYEIYGPFGISAETSIYFFPSGKIGKITEEDTYSITLRPAHRQTSDYSIPVEASFYLIYNTGEERNVYPEGTIGYWNGLNNVTAELPNDLDKILEIVKGHNIKHGGARK